jgi:hypothetical protein
MPPDVASFSAAATPTGFHGHRFAAATNLDVAACAALVIFTRLGDRQFQIAVLTLTDQYVPLLDLHVDCLLFVRTVPVGAIMPWVLLGRGT